ncbi:MAG TPA: dTMP kinase [Rhodothermales bacterium]|nr:dTMP kinase [Rhodothermales bacterium]
MFLSFEGIDGSGKSTQARVLLDRLRGEGEDARLLREPGGTELSERVRALLLTPELDVVPMAELLLFSAARAQLVAEQIRPALARGEIVICDRFYDSTVAYQGGGRMLADLEWLRDFNMRVTDRLAPDRTYLIALDAGVARERRSRRMAEGAPTPEDRMEAAGLAFQQRVAATYAALALAEPGRILCVDGHKPVEDIHEEIWADVQVLLRAREEH